MNPTSPTRFRGVLHAVDMLLKSMTQPSAQRTLLLYLRKEAIGPENAKCWKKILKHLRIHGHRGYTKNRFQTGWLQVCRQIGCFICSCRNGFYLPNKPEDFQTYITATTSRINSEKFNLRTAISLSKLQKEFEATEASRRTHTRTTAKRAGANRPTATRSPRKARSKSR